LSVDDLLADKVVCAPVAPLSTSKRHADRSREAILQAATTLFAEQGYASTTMQQIGTRAGLSRGTPGYFYGSKESLYGAVLERVFAQAGQALRRAREEADERGLSGEATFSHAIGAYIDFLVDRADFVRLVEWEALGHGRGLRKSSSHLDMAMAALQDMGEVLRDQLEPGFDISQLMLSIAGLCWFPVAHRETLGRVLAVDALHPEFVAARKRHVIGLVLNGIGGPRRTEKGQP
jgi:TetR/AcrR family transcriptional regulator